MKIMQSIVLAVGVLGLAACTANTSPGEGNDESVSSDDQALVSCGPAVASTELKTALNKFAAQAEVERKKAVRAGTLVAVDEKKMLAGIQAGSGGPQGLYYYNCGGQFMMSSSYVYQNTGCVLIYAD